jgi:hypothetical protein
MLSQKTLHELGKAVNFGYRCGFGPLKFNFKTNTISPSEGHIRSAVMYLNFFHMISYSIFHIFRLTAEINYRDESLNFYSQVFWLIVYTHGSCWFFTSSIWGWIKRYELAAFINAMAVTSADFQKGNYISYNNSPKN